MSETSLDTQEGFHLPHHAVVKNDSSTTKLRVVLDGSCTPETGKSINKGQCVGPTIQNDIFSMISRFPTHQYVLTADIRQMYRQIWVDPLDRQYQKIIWRSDENQPIASYTLNTVTFGMSSAPFLAIRCLFEIANINKANYPQEAQIIKEDFYVDDMLTDSNSLQNVYNLKRNITQI